MEVRKLVASVCLACSVFITASTVANADVVGGWSEEQGYFTNGVSNLSGDFTTYASKPKHKAYKKSRLISSQPSERVIGETTWTGVYHYSRARYEAWITKKPEADSGRVYGTNYTKATSGWHPGDLATAKTYYGKD